MPGEGRSGSPSGRNHALIIGIGVYDNWPELAGRAEAARAVAAVLMERYGFEKSDMVLLTDDTPEKPTQETITRQLEDLTGKLTSKDNLLFIFFGRSARTADGETYWIPRDGREKNQLNWFKHSDLCNEFFCSQNIRVGSLCIITDAPFSEKLIKYRPNLLSPNDLRYSEKSMDKAGWGSREVIFVKENEAAKDEKGIFLGRYLERKLLDNSFTVMDFENLFFTTDSRGEKTAFPGLSRGRLLCPMDNGGQFVLSMAEKGPAREVQAALPEAGTPSETVAGAGTLEERQVAVINARVTPERGVSGGEFSFTAETDVPANAVSLSIDGARYAMQGSGTQWRFSKKISEAGERPFTVTAANAGGREGPPKSGSIFVAESQPVEVAELNVRPGKIFRGKAFTIEAKTSGPADSVFVSMKGTRRPMTGSGTRWKYTASLKETGAVTFSVAARNAGGREGPARQGAFAVDEPPAAPVAETREETGGQEEYIKPSSGPFRIVSVQAVPKVVDQGKPCVFRAQTNTEVKGATLVTGGSSNEMRSESGTVWSFTKEFDNPGVFSYSVFATGRDGSRSAEAGGTVTVIAQMVNIMELYTEPDELIVGEPVTIVAHTDVPASGVDVRIKGVVHAMEGSGKEWRYQMIVPSSDERISLVVKAKNKEGEYGAAMIGQISAPRQREHESE
jgi:hypothetical protein